MNSVMHTADRRTYGLTQCAHCGELRHQDEVLVKTVHVGRKTQQEHFCSTDCHHAWYLNRLNTVGM